MRGELATVSAASQAFCFKIRVRYIIILVIAAIERVQTHPELGAVVNSLKIFAENLSRCLPRHPWSFETAVSQTDGTDVAISTRELLTERFVKGRSIG